MLERLHDLGAVQEPMEVRQHQQRRPLGSGQRRQTAERGEGIGGGGARGTGLAPNGKTLVDVPRGQCPAFLPAEVGQFPRLAENHLCSFVAFIGNCGRGHRDQEQGSE
jgi:hypothetical protein